MLYVNFGLSFRNITFQGDRGGNMFTLHSKRRALLKGYDENVVQKIKALPTVLGIFFMAKPGGIMEPTVDVGTVPGFVIIASTDTAQQARDEAAIREMEDKLWVTGVVPEGMSNGGHVF